MGKFKQGDKVVVLNINGSDARVGMEYYIAEYDSDYNFCLGNTPYKRLLAHWVSSSDVRKVHQIYLGGE